MKVTYIIVDDDLLSRELLKSYCQKITYLHCKGTFADAQQALDYLKNNAIDLLLLDIEMPIMTGVDLLNFLPVLPTVIFTTSNSRYAYEAFELEAVDFLKKPFRFKRFEKAIEKAVQLQKEKNTLTSNSNDIYIKEKGKYKRILLDDILYFENVTDYVCIKTISGTYTIISTLKSIDSKLPRDRFMKVHRSYIVNLDKILDIDESTLVVDKKVIPISRSNRPLLMNKINLL